MLAIVSHRSACEALRLLSPTAPRWPEAGMVCLVPEACVATQRAFEAATRGEGLPLIGALSRPVDLLVPDASRHRRGKQATFHVWRHPVPASSLRLVADGLVASGPELSVLQLSAYQFKADALIDAFAQDLQVERAVMRGLGVEEDELFDDPLEWERKMRLVRLALVASEFMGTYRLGVAGGKTRYKVARLTSPVQMRGMLAKMPGLFGVGRAKRALDLAFESSASPSETALALLLSLPCELGGYGLPKPELNAPVAVGGAPSVRQGLDFVKPDLLWRDARVAAEYDSDEFHLERGRRQAATDARRSNALCEGGCSCLRVTTAMLSSESEMDVLAGQLAHLLGVPSPRGDGLVRLRRHRLRAVLGI